MNDNLTFSLHTLIEPRWASRLKTCGLRFLDPSIIKQYRELCQAIASNPQSYDELSQFALSDIERQKLHSAKKIEELQGFVKNYVEVYRAHNSVKWHKMRAESLAKSSFRAQLSALSSNPYTKEQLENYAKHAELAHYPAKALLLGDTLRICIAYVESALVKLKKEKQRWHWPWENRLTQEEHAALEKLLNEELAEKKRQLTVLHEAQLARLKSASRHHDPAYEGVISDMVCLLVEFYCLKENQKPKAIQYQRAFMDEQTFLSLHEELLRYGSNEIKQRLLKCYWMQPQSGMAIATAETPCSVFPLPSVLANYLDRPKNFNKHWWNQGRYFRSQLARKLIFPIAKINGALERLKTETFIGVPGNGEIYTLDSDNISNHPTWQLLQDTEQEILKNIGYYREKLKKYQGKWFKGKTNASLKETITVFEQAKKPLAQCYLQFAQTLVQALLYRLHQQKPRTTLLSPQAAKELGQLFVIMEQKLQDTVLYAEYLETKTSLEALIELDETLFFDKLKQGKPLSKLEKDHWIPATNEVTEKDEQCRLMLIKAASEGLYHQLCQPITLDEAGITRIQVIENILDFLYSVTAIARNNAKDRDIPQLQKRMLEYVSFIEDQLVDDYIRYLLAASQLDKTQWNMVKPYCQLYENFYQHYLKDNRTVALQLSELTQYRENDQVMLYQNRVKMYQTTSVQIESRGISRTLRETERTLHVLQRALKAMLLGDYFGCQQADYRAFKQLSANQWTKSQWNEQSYFGLDLKERQLNMLIGLLANVLLTKQRIKEIENTFYLSKNSLSWDSMNAQLQDAMLYVERQFQALISFEEITPFKTMLTGHFNVRFFTQQKEVVNSPQRPFIFSH